MSRSGTKPRRGLVWVCAARTASMQDLREGKEGVYLSTLERQGTGDGGAQVAVGVLGRHATPRCPPEEPQLEQVRLDDVLHGVGLLAHGGGERREPHRTAAELVDQGVED